MRAIVLVCAMALSGCDSGLTIKDAYNMSVTETEGRIPKRVSVCWALQASYMNGEREDGVEQDIVDTCNRASREVELSGECREYAAIASRYGEATLRGADLRELARESETAFSECAT
ncbi:MAG: hypothetical protein ABS87_01505 [Sphingomonas sp. SCN 67-18]|nr:hypothetical protein [Sphingomonas sp. SCN 67-18]ODU22682.1 MAG: hypothetical protein ABS87_01505 [Sphingomonas sp. SCN 67-18]